MRTAECLLCCAASSCRVLAVRMQLLTLQELPPLVFFLRPTRACTAADCLVWRAANSCGVLAVCMQPLPEGGDAPDATHPAVPHTRADAAGEAAVPAATPEVPDALL